MKMQHPDRVGDQPPVELGDDPDYLELYRQQGWVEVDDKTGKPKD